MNFQFLIIFEVPQNFGDQEFDKKQQTACLQCPIIVVLDCEHTTTLSSFNKVLEWATFKSLYLIKLLQSTSKMEQ